MDQPQRYLASPAYAMAAILVAFPTAEVVLSLIPWRFGVTAWRFSAVGLLSRALMTPMLGVLMLAGLAILLGHRRFLRVLSVLSILGAAVLLVALGTFVLDALEMRGQVRPELKRAFDTASLQAAVKLLISAVWLGMLAAAGFRVTRRARAERRSGRRTEPILAAAVSGSPTDE